MTTLIKIKNFAQPYKDREVQEVETLDLEKVRKDYEKENNCKALVTIDTKVVSDNYKWKPTDKMLIISPLVAGGGNGGKNILGIIAMVALTAVAMGVGGMVAAHGFWGAAVSTWSTWSYVLAGTIMMLGGQLISNAFASKMDDTSNETTYSWSGIQTAEGQGGYVAITYGTIRSGGQTLQKYSLTFDNKQYLYWLICAGEGPLNIYDVKLNDNSISYYEDITADIREGTNTQSVIPNLNDTYTNKSLSYEVKQDTWRTESTLGNSVQGFVVDIQFPSGLYHTSYKGNEEKTWVTIQIQYRLAGGNWVDWKTETIKDCIYSALYKQYRIDYIAAGNYEIRMRVTNREYDVEHVRTSNRVYWTGIETVVYDDFQHPNKALIGIKAKATSQISGSPTLKFMKSRPSVYVWNPYTSSYETKASDNPAWAAYDMLHGCRHLQHPTTGVWEYNVRGVPKEMLMYDRFLEWANDCDSKKLKINIEIAKVGDVMSVINENIANIGRGMIVKFGTKFGPIWDHAQLPVQMFGMGNIISGSFEETFLSLSDRADAVEVTFTNAEKEYERDTVTVYSDSYDDNDSLMNTTSVTMDGVTNREQAFRQAKYQLYCNKYLRIGCSFEADIDAINCMVGDVILVNHDVPQWSYSGRIESVNATNREIVIPCLETPTEGNYVLQYRSLNDTIVTLSILSWTKSGDYIKVVADSDFSTENPPEKDDIFAFGISTIVSKPFTVINITQTQAFRRKITGLEYNENVFNENYVIPTPNYSTAKNTYPQNVTNLNGKQTQFVNASGTAVGQLSISWQCTGYYTGFDVYLSEDGTNWTWRYNTSSLQASLEVSAYTDYYVKVITSNIMASSSGVVIGPIAAGTDSIPPDVTELDVEKLSSGTRRYHWTFEYPVPNDIKGFRIKHLQGNNINWDLGTEVAEGIITSQPYEAKTLRDGTHTVMIKAVDNAGNESENLAYVVLDLGETLKENVLQEFDLSNNSWEAVTTNGYVNPHTGYLESSSNNNMWTTGKSPMWVSASSPMWGSASYKSLTISASIKTNCGGRLGVDFYGDNLLTLQYRVLQIGTFWKGNEDSAFWQTPDTSFWSTNWGMWFTFSAKANVEAGTTIEFKGTSDSSTNKTIIKKLIPYVDVPDRTEHFEDLVIPINGMELDIKTPNYYTVAVRIDSISGTNELLQPQLVSRQPCYIKILNSSGESVAATCDITWQGYEKEVEV